MTIGMIDTIALGILILSILFALYRGLVTELLCISAWILAGFGAIYSYTPMQKIMHGLIENEKLAGLCGSALVALVILVIMTITNNHINKKLRQSSLSGLDRVLGMVFGGLRAVLLMALIYMAASVILSESFLVEMEKGNVSMPYIRKTVVFLKKFMPQNVQDDLGLNEPEDSADKPQKKIGTDLNRSHKLPEKSHQKAIKRLVDEVKEKPQQKEEASKVEKKSKTLKSKAESNHKTGDKKTKPKEKQSDASAAVPQYNSNERKSLDNMVEQLMEKGE